MPIIQYWHSEQVPHDVAAAITTVRDANPEQPHLLFNEASAREFIAEHMGKRELAAFRSCAVPAMQSDYFRYCAVLVHGGAWVDADCFCQRPVLILLGPGDSGLLTGAPGSGLPTNNHFLLFPKPDHPLPRLLVETATANIEQRLFDDIAFVTGPWLVMSLAQIGRWGSFEGILRDLPDLVRTYGLSLELSEKARRLLKSIARTVGDAGRIVDAFRGVRVVPGDHYAKWVRHRQDFAYKQGDTHWPNWQGRGGSIFR